MAQMYITTQWGACAVVALPPELRAGIEAAKFTKRGTPDKRSRKSVEAFCAVEAWMADRFLTHKTAGA
jgi:hypothetical protein